jgi:hypothetical protein
MTGHEGDRWRARFDEISVETRRCLPWARHVADQRDAAYRLSLLMARLSFDRGRPGESQRRFELAAHLAPDDTAATAALRQAAGAAEGRQFGNEALRLRALAAQAALRAGDRTGAALDLARAAELVVRGPGIFTVLPPHREVERLLSQARSLSDGGPVAEARILTAEACSLDVRDPEVRRLAQRAFELARGAGDLLGESAALDALTAAQLADGELKAALDSAVRRTELLEPLPVTAESALEFFDAYQMASQCAVASGDLAEGRRLGTGLSELPFYREEGHLAMSRLVVVGLLTGEWDVALEQAEVFAAGWERAGRPVAGNLRTAPYAAATIHALRGDDTARAGWMRIVEALVTPGRPLSTLRLSNYFDALPLVHRGLTAEALAVLHDEPENLTADYNGMWRPWYAALWAEAAVLAGLPDAEDRVRRARHLTGENPVAGALARRLEGLARTRNGETARGRDDLVAAASALRSLGARYEWARTLVMLGGPDEAQGRAELAALGATPMAWPPG